MESMSFGKPIIGSDIGGIPELVINNKTGLLFRCGDYVDLSQKIRWLYDMENKIYEFGKNAKKIAYNEFNSESYYLKLNNIYNSLMCSN